jgi:hypothetical protein
LNRPFKSLLVAAVVVATPVPVLAQTWPATVVAAGPRMAAAPARAFVVIERDGRLQRRPPGVPRTEPHAAPLRLSAADEVPQVDIRAKDEWSEDQGLRVGPTRVAFKRRF